MGQVSTAGEAGVLTVVIGEDRGGWRDGRPAVEMHGLVTWRQRGRLDADQHRSGDAWTNAKAREKMTHGQQTRVAQMQS